MPAAADMAFMEQPVPASINYEGLEKINFLAKHGGMFNPAQLAISFQ